MDLTQNEIDYLLSVLKEVDMKNGNRFDFPVHGASKKINLISCDNNKDKFIIDVNRRKGKIQNQLYFSGKIQKKLESQILR